MGVCALCKEDRKLIKSHLIPRSAYKYARDSSARGGGDLVKVMTTDNVAFFSDEQVVKELLCASCEDVFSKNGEKIVGECWARHSTFPLLSALSDSDAIVGERFSVYGPKAIESRLKKGLFYFAISIFWRANVWDWGRKSDRYVGALGPKYEKEFRDFLLGKKDLDNAYLLLTVNSSELLNGLISFPVANKINRATVHIFDILGLKFTLIVGGHIPDALKKPFKVMQSNLVILTSPLEKSPDFIELSKYIRANVIARGRLLTEEGPFG